MKRLSYIALLAVGLVLASQQQASAWSKFNFGVGLNIGWEGGGNSVLWGALKGAPSPGGFDGGYPGFPGGGFNNMPPAHAGLGSDQQFPTAGYSPYQPPSPMMAMPSPAPMPQIAPMPQMPRADTQPVGYFTYPTYPNYYPYPQYYTNYYYGTWYAY
jgi:hypothetical protein